MITLVVFHLNVFQQAWAAQIAIVGYLLLSNKGALELLKKGGATYIGAWVAYEVVRLLLSTQAPDAWFPLGIKVLGTFLLFELAWEKGRPSPSKDRTSRAL